VPSANESSRHSPSDEAKRDQTAAIETPGRDESASQIAFSATSAVTAMSIVDQRDSSAMPHHAERDGDFADSIGTTSNHPFWSVDRQEYVPAGQLEIGERLQTLHGDTKTVVSNLPRPGPETDVYNLEVHVEHVYFVGEDGVLVHNSKAYSGPTLRKRADGTWETLALGPANNGRRWQPVNALKSSSHGNSHSSTALNALYAKYDEAGKINGRKAKIHCS